VAAEKAKSRRIKALERASVRNQNIEQIPINTRSGGILGAGGRWCASSRPGIDARLYTLETLGS
jgi:hypothetical protein